MANLVSKGLNTYGKFQASAALIVTGLIVSSFVPLGAYMLKNPQDMILTGNVSAVDSNCNANVCIATVNSKQITFNKKVSVGDQVSIPEEKTPKFIPIMIIICPIISFLIACIVAYYAYTSSGFSQVFGGVSAIGALTSR